MAPRKRKAPAGPSLPARVTRSAAKLAAAAAAGAAEPSSSVAVEKKSKKGKQKKEVEEKASTEDVAASETEEAEGGDSGPAKKKAKIAKGKKKMKAKKKEVEDSAETEEEGEDEEEDAASENDVEGSKTIVIEHCKQCNSFKTRANQVKEGLEKRVEGLTVILNPDKPRRGCFEIREEGGKTFISLLDMKRPFKPMKDLDMEKVISDIVDEISTAD